MFTHVKFVGLVQLKQKKNLNKMLQFNLFIFMDQSNTITYFILYIVANYF